MSAFKKAQMDTIKALENLYEEGGYLEKSKVCEAVNALHSKVFALSYEDVYRRSKALLKRGEKLS